MQALTDFPFLYLFIAAVLIGSCWMFRERIVYFYKHYTKTTRTAIGLAISLFAIGGWIYSATRYHAVGEFLMAGTVVHFLYEIFVKTTFEEELCRTILGRYSSKMLGVQSYYIPDGSNKPSDEYQKLIEDAIESSERLDIAANYSLGIFTHYKQNFIKRKTNNRETNLILLKQDSMGDKYLTQEVEMANNADAKKLFKSSRDISGSLINTAAVELGISPNYHHKVLRYEFMRSDKYIWIAPYLNTNRVARPPWLVFSHESPLFNFYNSEIDAFIQEIRTSPNQDTP